MIFKIFLEEHNQNFGTGQIVPKVSNRTHLNFLCKTHHFYS